jgi:hypothetical protein
MILSTYLEFHILVQLVLSCMSCFILILIYLTHDTTSVVSRFMANRGKKHRMTVQWIFRYLQGTSNTCL